MIIKKYPEWSSKKQKEGMDKFRSIADEFGDFCVEFNQVEHEEDDQFNAVVTWENYKAKGKRKHEFWIAWDYERTWDKYGKILKRWQFVFSGGDCAQSLSIEMFYISLFFYMDELLNIKE